MKTFYLVISLSLLCFSYSYSQEKKLEIYEVNNGSTIEINSKSTIFIKLNDELKTVLRGKYTIENDSTLLIRDTLINISSIQSIKLIPQHHREKAKKTFIKAGVLGLIGTTMWLGGYAMAKNQNSSDNERGSTTGFFVAFTGAFVLFSGVGVALSGVYHRLHYNYYPLAVANNKGEIISQKKTTSFFDKSIFFQQAKRKANEMYVLQIVD